MVGEKQPVCKRMSQWADRLLHGGGLQNVVSEKHRCQYAIFTLYVKDYKENKLATEQVEIYSLAFA